MGRTPRQYDKKEADLVAVLIGLGLTHEEVAGVVGISAPTLRKLYREELEHGRAKLHAKIGARIARRAMSDEPNADAISMFFAKTRMGWREYDSGAGTQTITIERSYGAKNNTRNPDPDTRPELPSGADSDEGGPQAL